MGAELFLCVYISFCQNSFFLRDENNDFELPCRLHAGVQIVNRAQDPLGSDAEPGRGSLNRNHCKRPRVLGGGVLAGQRRHVDRRTSRQY